MSAGTLVRGVSRGLEACKKLAGPANFAVGMAGFPSFSCLKIVKDKIQASKFSNLNALTGETMIPVDELFDLNFYFLLNFLEILDLLVECNPWTNDSEVRNEELGISPGDLASKSLGVQSDLEAKFQVGFKIGDEKLAQNLFLQPPSLSVKLQHVSWCKQNCLAPRNWHGAPFTSLD